MGVEGVVGRAYIYTHTHRGHDTNNEKWRLFHGSSLTTEGPLPRFAVFIHSEPLD